MAEKPHKQKNVKIQSRADKISRKSGGFMKTALSKKVKTIAIYFNESDRWIEVQTYNTDQKSTCPLMPPSIRSIADRLMIMKRES